jgi:hypothetical protein
MTNRATRTFDSASDTKLYYPTSKSADRAVGVVVGDESLESGLFYTEQFGLFQNELGLLSYRNKGEGIVFNGLCAMPTANAKVWSLQFNVTAETRKEGFPVVMGWDYQTPTDVAANLNLARDRYLGKCHPPHPVDLATEAQLDGGSE